MTATLSKVLMGVSAAMVIAIFFMWRANAALNEEVGAARVSIAQATLTNNTNLVTITNLTTEINQCVEQQAIDEVANQETLVALRVQIADLEAREPLVRIIREEIFRDPSCEVLGNLDLGAACPALVDSLRERSHGLDPGGNSGSEGAGADTDAG